MLAAVLSIAAIGILFGLATRWPTGARAVQAGGAVIAGTGAFFLWGALG